MALSPISKKKILFEEQITIGEFDPSVDGAYRNVKTFPVQVRPGEMFISVDSDKPVDIAVSNGSGICIKFKESILNDVIGPIRITEKDTAALAVGVFRGDKAEPKIRIWMG
ncbi:MAG: hypothetical protein FWF40_02065 [Methanomassiliicoccaceae archaeon]|nr:hypothetical protein [Methanomassiliicoccaceae archaeon]